MVSNKLMLYPYSPFNADFKFALRFENRFDIKFWKSFHVKPYHEFCHWILNCWYGLTWKLFQILISNLLSNLISGFVSNNLHSLLVYVEQGRSTTSTTLTFTTASTSGITWKAKVTQIECYRWVSSLFPFIFHLHFKVGNSPLAVFASGMEAQMFFLNV